MSTERILSDWSKHKFLHPNEPAKVNWNGFPFPSVAHALTFAQISPTFSFEQGALEKLAKKVAKSKTKQLREFDTLPKVSNWYDSRMAEAMWSLNLQKYADKRVRRRLLDIRGCRFAFTTGYGGREVEKFSGCRVRKGEVMGHNLYGRSLDALRTMLLSRLVVLVCGGRDYDDDQFIFRVLDYIDSVYKIKYVVHGAATGADRIAGRWAKLSGKPPMEFPAKWDDLSVPNCKVRVNSRGEKYNVLAGFNRNSDMLRHMCKQVPGTGYKQTMVLGFTGGTGTFDMLSRSFNAGLPTFYQEGGKMRRVSAIEGDTLVLEAHTLSRRNRVDGTPWFSGITST